MFVALWCGVYWIVVAQVVTCFIHYCLKAIPNKKLYGYGLFAQIKDIFPYLLLTALMVLAVYWLNFVEINQYLILLLQVGIGSCFYLGMSIIFKMSAFKYLWGIARSFVEKFIRKEKCVEVRDENIEENK